MVNESAIEHPSEVKCLFCGQRTPGPMLVGVRRLPDTNEETNFRVSVIRCHKCGKEAPYSSDHVIRNGETPKKRSANAA